VETECSSFLFIMCSFPIFYALVPISNCGVIIKTKSQPWIVSYVAIVETILKMKHVTWNDIFFLLYLACQSPGKNNTQLMTGKISLSSACYPLVTQPISISAPCSTQRGHCSWIAVALELHCIFKQCYIISPVIWWVLFFPREYIRPIFHI
jgi:hypothetical protein